MEAHSRGHIKIEIRLKCIQVFPLGSLRKNLSFSMPASFNSLRVVFPAACAEFVIPAKAGIQKTRLDSVSSTE